MAFTGRALAWLNLAWHFNRHIFGRLPKRALGGSGDAERFRNAVEPEGYLPLQPSERALMPDAMRCINCGLCAIATAPERPHSAWDDAWTFVAGHSRSIDRASIVTTEDTPADAMKMSQAVCPAGVPIHDMFIMLQRIGADARTVIRSTEQTP